MSTPTPDNLVVSPLSANIQLVDPQTGIPSAYGQRALTRIIQAINGALTILGQFNGIIGTGATVEGQSGTVAAKVQHLGPTGNLNAVNLTGIVAAAQLPAAIPLAQGAVQLPAGALTNVLGSAALQPTASFDPAGAAATAQAAAEAASDPLGSAAAAKSAAEAYALALFAAGVNGTINLAKLTVGGTNGSITVTNGLITGFVNPT